MSDKPDEKRARDINAVREAALGDARSVFKATLDTYAAEGGTKSTGAIAAYTLARALATALEDFVRNEVGPRFPDLEAAARLAGDDLHREVFKREPDDLFEVRIRAPKEIADKIVALISSDKSIRPPDAAFGIRAGGKDPGPFNPNLN